jgi:hypothetical protein
VTTYQPCQDEAAIGGRPTNHALHKKRDEEDTAEQAHPKDHRDHSRNTEDAIFKQPWLDDWLSTSSL